jgi:molybdenum cofactor cytidylyltransferase
MTPAAIILAAGTSSRFGGETKQLAQLNGKALVSHVAQAALDAKLSPVITVLGHKADDVRAALARDVGADKSLIPVHAEKYADGMAESLKAGIAALPNDCDAAFVLLADMPFVNAALLAQLSTAYDSTKLAIAPTWQDQRGNPVLLTARAFPLVANLTGDRGLGPILNQRKDEVTLIEASDDSCLRDIDTKDALKSS